MRRPPPAHAPAGLRASRGPVLAQESRPAARRRAPTPPASRAAGSPRLCRQESAGEWGAPPRAGHRRPRATGPHPPLARPPAACSRLAAAGSNWRRRERRRERGEGQSEGRGAAAQGNTAPRAGFAPAAGEAGASRQESQRPAGGREIPGPHCSLIQSMFLLDSDSI